MGVEFGVTGWPRQTSRRILGEFMARSPFPLHDGGRLGWGWSLASQIGPAKHPASVVRVRSKGLATDRTGQTPWLDADLVLDEL